MKRKRVTKEQIISILKEHEDLKEWAGKKGSAIGRRQRVGNMVSANLTRQRRECRLVGLNH